MKQRKKLTDSDSISRLYYQFLRVNQTNLSGDQLMNSPSNLHHRTQIPHPSLLTRIHRDSVILHKARLTPPIWAVFFATELHGCGNPAARLSPIWSQSCGLLSAIVAAPRSLQWSLPCSRLAAIIATPLPQLWPHDCGTAVAQSSQLRSQGRRNLAATPSQLCSHDRPQHIRNPR